MMQSSLARQIELSCTLDCRVITPHTPASSSFGVTAVASQELRPPKITPDDYVELVDRVEKLSRGGLREPTGEHQ